MAATKIMISTPTAGGVAKVPFVVTLVDVVRTLMSNGIDVGFVNYDSSDIVMARNFAASRLLTDESYTHLLFIDSDMSFDAKLVLRYLHFGQPFVGSVYTKRAIDIDALKQAVESAAKQGKQTRMIEDLSSVMEFVIRLEGGDSGKRDLTVQGGFTKVDGVGMGLTLLQRSVFTTMIEREVVRKKKGGRFPKSAGDKVYNFFDPLVPQGRDEALSEDLAFCYRWQHFCSGEVWACIDVPIGHVGQFVYTGVFLEKLRQGKRRSVGA